MTTVLQHLDGTLTLSVKGDQPTICDDPACRCPLIELELRPLTILVPGFPLDTMRGQEQVHADNLQQPRYIQDHDGRIHTVYPNPDSPFQHPLPPRG